MISKQQLMQDFLLKTPVGYHAQSLNRAAHLQSASLRKASVLVGFVERPQGLSVVLTKRAAHLKHHPGQISFPGGKYEASDGTLYQTAKREAHEEIGLEAKYIKILGQLPELVTISQFAVTPVIAFIDPRYEMSIDTNEVEEVFEVPAAYLFDQKHLLSNTFLIKNSLHKVFALPYKHHFIWGMTAQIIQALQKHIDSDR
ncbi:CoA pyrophosphatase [Vibrio metschnikovii]|uniref:CoA pyrophosphatase n=1 Tax=Vibrio metschnikovii TaxID=28172 RepID=UPI002FE5281B